MTLRRNIHPTEIRVLDAAQGLVRYIASNETLDTYQECIRANGWMFDSFGKNPAFVDSHNYESIDCLLGKVVDFGVKGAQLIETVKWAIDVPQNLLAQKGFAMTAAGYLKAVSVGFMPVEVVSPQDRDVTDYNDLCEEMGLDPADASARPRCISVRQQQLELSVCIIGANPDAVALEKSYQAGILNDADCEHWPTLGRIIEKSRHNPSRSFSFPSTPTPSPRMRTLTPRQSAILDKLNKPGSSKSADSPAAANLDRLEAARRGQSESELLRVAAAVTSDSFAARRRAAASILRAAAADGQTNLFCNGLPRLLCGYRTPGEQSDVVKRSLTPAPGSFGATLLPQEVAFTIFNLASIYGAWSELSVQDMTSTQTRFPLVTAYPQGVWITPSSMGATIPSDSSLAGSGTSIEANTLGIILPISRELLSDSRVDLTTWFLECFSNALAASLDFAALVGTGANDTVSGSQTGIFNDATIPSASAVQNNTVIAQLNRADFVAAIEAVAPAALQRDCKWLISTSFIAPLLLLTDTQAKDYLLKTPAETGDGTFRLCGFEVIFSPQAPSTNAAGQKIAAFGAFGSAYLVGIRQALEIMMSEGAMFSSNTTQFRAITRAFCQTRQSSWMSTLALANS